MTNQETTLWGIRGGAIGEADALFLNSNCIAVGWPKVGDLSKLAANGEAFKAKVAQWYPDLKPGAIPVSAGVLFRFVHEMKPGHLVAYPSKRDRQIHIGRIEVPYQYDPSLNEPFPNQRSVKWLAAVPRTRFTQGALSEIGAYVTLFLIRKYADEFVAAAEGRPPANEGDPTVRIVAEETKQNTEDFIIKQLAKNLKGHPLEEFVANLLHVMGYQTRVAPVGQDQGVDIVAHRDELGFEPPVIRVQVKSSEGTIGAPDVQAIYGIVGEREHGMVVTLGTFTTQAVAFARSKGNLRLIDGTELVDLVLRHYDDLDARYKGILPLKRVYVPEPVTEVE
jgi:restriction system protein